MSTCSNFGQFQDYFPGSRITSYNVCYTKLLRTGGVAGAVAAYLDGKADYRPEAVDGLSVANVKTLKRYATKKGTVPGNMLEVMCCEGGCISGPGTIALPNKATRTVTKYKESSPTIKGTTNEETTSSCGGGCSGCKCCG